MKVTVVFQANTEANLRSWLSRLAASRPGGEVISAVVLEELLDRLTETAGEMPEAIPILSRDPTEYMRGLWIAFVRIDSGTWFWKRRLKLAKLPSEAILL